MLIDRGADQPIVPIDWRCRLAGSVEWLAVLTGCGADGPAVLMTDGADD
ncbi:hypothetical protein HLK59_27945 [Streptomyces sp. S3(2020)]|nr:hypothetical protein [Streptomyces sp. S3(2020)]NNN34126.1 hypothetical protein [Streptomyces sp. S3(2020)]